MEIQGPQCLYITLIFTHGHTGLLYQKERQSPSASIRLLYPELYKSQELVPTFPYL